jgi:hypothetical protein
MKKGAQSRECDNGKSLADRTPWKNLQFSTLGQKLTGGQGVIDHLHEPAEVAAKASPLATQVCNREKGIIRKTAKRYGDTGNRNQGASYCI